MGLTSGDVVELTYFFTTEGLAAYAGETLRAQTYEPRGSGVYNPTTDLRLMRLVGAALHRSRSEESRLRRIVGHLLETPDGRRHFDVLRRAFTPLPRLALPTSIVRYPEVACITTAALERGRELARKEGHMRMLEAAYEAAHTAGCSPIATAMRVYEADWRVTVHGVRIQDEDVRSAASRAIDKAIAAGDSAFLETVRNEMNAIVNVAGDAYREAREQVGATRRKDKADRQKDADSALRAELGKKKRKDRQRFMADPQRAETLRVVEAAFAALQAAS